MKRVLLIVAFSCSLCLKAIGQIDDELTVSMEKHMYRTSDTIKAAVTYWNHQSHADTLGLSYPSPCSVCLSVDSTNYQTWTNLNSCIAAGLCPAVMVPCIIPADSFRSWMTNILPPLPLGNHMLIAGILAWLADKPVDLGDTTAFAVCEDTTAVCADTLHEITLTQQRQNYLPSDTLRATFRCYNHLPGAVRVFLPSPTSGCSPYTYVDSTDLSSKNGVVCPDVMTPYSVPADSFHSWTVSISPPLPSGYHRLLGVFNGRWSVWSNPFQDTCTGTFIVGVGFTKGWNLLSLPFLEHSAVRQVLFPTATSQAYTYGPGGYVMSDTIPEHRGFLDEVQRRWIFYPGRASSVN